MTQITIIDDQVAARGGPLRPGRSTFLVEAGPLPEALGWELKASGLCRAPPASRSRTRLAAVGDGRRHRRRGPGPRPPRRRRRGRPAGGRRAPPELAARPWSTCTPPVSSCRPGGECSIGSTSGPGRRSPGRLLELVRMPLRPAGLAALHDELSPEGFTVIAVAIDQSAADVRPFTDGITMPVLYDPHHLLTESTPSPTCPPWSGSTRRTASPGPTESPSAPTCSPTSPGSNPGRTWTRCGGGRGKGTVPRDRDDARRAVGDLSADEVLARLHFRVAAEAHRRGEEAVTRRHVATASALAPDDLTIWRAGMPLVGEDPFGDDFLARYEEWKAAGHALPRAAGGGQDRARGPMS